MGAPALQDHCRRGHAFTPENVYWTPAGVRTCRACKRIVQSEYARAARANPCRGERKTFMAEANAMAQDARHGSDQLRRSLLRYGLRHGLPNMSRLQCLREMRALVDIRWDELELANRIERELVSHIPLPPVSERL